MLINQNDFFTIELYYYLQGTNNIIFSNNLIGTII